MNKLTGLDKAVKAIKNKNKNKDSDITFNGIKLNEYRKNLLDVYLYKKPINDIFDNQNMKSRGTLKMHMNSESNELHNIHKCEPKAQSSKNIPGI